MDITDTLAPKSDQLNAEDLLTGPRTVTVEKVTKGSAEQPVDIHLVEFPGRPFRPSKTVRRILVTAWGPEASAYTGRKMTLYRDASVKYGGMEVGGIRVSHLSHIDKRFNIVLTTTRGKRAPHIIEPLIIDPLPDAQPDDTITKQQLQQLSTLRQHAGYADDDQGRVDWCQWVQSSIGRLIGTNKDLTGAEATVLIDLLENPESPEQ